MLTLKTPSLCGGIRSSVSLAHHTCVFHSTLIAAYCTASLLMAPIRTFHSTTGGGGGCGGWDEIEFTSSHIWHWAADPIIVFLLRSGRPSPRENRQGEGVKSRWRARNPQHLLWICKRNIIGDWNTRRHGEIGRGWEAGGWRAGGGAFHNRSYFLFLSPGPESFQASLPTSPLSRNIEMVTPRFHCAYE